MIDRALELKAKYGFRGHYGLLSHGLAVSRRALAKDQPFSMCGIGWYIEFDGLHYKIHAHTPFEGSVEQSKYLHVATVSGETRWLVSMLGQAADRWMTPVEIKAQYGGMDCGDRIILVENGTVIGYIHRYDASSSAWQPLRAALCHCSTPLPEICLCYLIGRDTHEGPAQEIKKMYTCIADGDFIYLVKNKKVVGNVARCVWGNMSWAAIKHYLVEMP